MSYEYLIFWSIWIFFLLFLPAGKISSLLFSSHKHTENNSFFFNFHPPVCILFSSLLGGFWPCNDHCHHPLSILCQLGPAREFPQTRKTLQTERKMIISKVFKAIEMESCCLCRNLVSSRGNDGVPVNEHWQQHLAMVRGSASRGPSGSPPAAPCPLQHRPWCGDLCLCRMQEQPAPPGASGGEMLHTDPCLVYLLFFFVSPSCSIHFCPKLAN